MSVTTKQKRNFHISRGVEFCTEAECFDLHNFYDFSSLIYGSDGTFRVYFEPSGCDVKDGPTIRLVFNELQYLSFNLRDAQNSHCDVDEIGYKSSDDHDLEWLKTEQQTEADDHLVIRLSGDSFIRAYASEIILEPIYPPLSENVSRLPSNLKS